MDRIVDVATDNLHLAAYRGFLRLTQTAADGSRHEVGRVALNDIAGVIVHGHGISWSTNVAIELAARGATMVLCGRNHAPIAYLTAIEGHHAQNARFRAQWDAPRPMMKRAWQQVVAAKVNMQASLPSPTIWSSRFGPW